MKNPSYDYINEMCRSLSPEFRKEFMAGIAKCAWESANLATSVKATPQEYAQRPVLPKDMNGVTEKNFGSAFQNQKSNGKKSGRFCPTWEQREFEKGDSVIHMPTGAIFVLMRPEYSQGGWVHRGWATNSYGGRVNTEYTVPQNVLNAVGAVESFGAYSALVKPNKKKNQVYNPGEWLCVRTMRTVGQHNYACEKKHKVGQI